MKNLDPLWTDWDYPTAEAPSVLCEYIGLLADIVSRFTAAHSTCYDYDSLRLRLFYDLRPSYGVSVKLMIFYDDYFRCMPIKEKVYWIDVMIKKSRAGLALRLILAGVKV